MATSTVEKTTENSLLWSNEEGVIVCRAHTGHELGTVLHIREAQGDSDLNGPFFTSFGMWERMTAEEIRSFQYSVRDLPRDWHDYPCDGCRA